MASIQYARLAPNIEAEKRLTTIGQHRTTKKHNTAYRKSARGGC